MNIMDEYWKDDLENEKPLYAKRLKLMEK